MLHLPSISEAHLSNHVFFLSKHYSSLPHPLGFEPSTLCTTAVSDSVARTDVLSIISELIFQTQRQLRLYNSFLGSIG